MDTVSMLNKMSFYCQPILPLVYDESMSYYETLCKVVGQLNTTGDAVNKLNEGLTGEIADRQAADALLDERLKLIEATNAKIHFLIFDGANPNGGFPTRSELYQWVHEGDAIFTLFRTYEEGRGQIYAASCSYNAGNWGSEASNDFSIIVPLETSHDDAQDYAVRQKIAKLSIPLSPQTNLNVAWRLQIIEVNTPYTSADGVVNLVAVINDSDSVNCSITPSEFLGLYNMTRGGKNLCVAVNAKLAYDGLARSSSVATVDTTNRKIRIAFERDHGTFINNGVKQLNKTLDYIIGDVSTNVWTHETIDSKTLDFSRYEGFQFTRGAHNVITANDDSTPNAVYTQYHSDTSGKIYQNLPVRLVDTVDNAEYWNGAFDIKDDRHMTFTFVTSNYVTASRKMLVRVIELSADVDTTTWNYSEQEFELPITGSFAVDDALSDTSTNPVQNKVVTTALNGKASTAVASRTANGLMSTSDYIKLLDIENGATNTVVDAELNSNSTNPVQNKAVKTALDGKASTEVASQTANGLMSKDDKKKLDDIDEGAIKTTVIDALDPLSHNPVSSAALFEALSSKADRTEATEQAAGLMSAKDKKKLNDIEDGANKTIVDEMLSDGSANPVQNKVVTAALASVVRETIYPIAVTATSTEWAVNNGIAYKEASADRTFDNIKAAYNGNKTPVCEFEGMTYSLVLDSSTEFVFASYRGAVGNDPQYAGLGKYPTSLITINTTGVVISRTAGDLPAVDASDNGKMPIVTGGAWALQRVPDATVDTELSTTSENPVQNKTVTDALNGKLPKTGGTVTGALRTNDSFSAGGTISFGEAPIGLSQTADGAAQIRYGSADVDDNPPPLSRLKVARPNADDDAATKKYVDDRNNSPQFKGYVTLTPANEPIGTGVGLSPSRSGNHFTLDISDVNEGTPTLLSGVKTPTDADTNAAATVEYVKAKVASGGSSDFVITGTLSGDTLTTDKTYEQVQEAVQAGKIVTLKVNVDGIDIVLYRIGKNDSAYLFATVATVMPGLIAQLTASVGEAGQNIFIIASVVSYDSNGNLMQATMDSDPTEAMQIATKQYVDGHLSVAPITIKLGTGHAATSTATFAEIKAALEAGKAPVLDSATGNVHWFALNWMLFGSDSLAIQYGTFNVEGGGLATFAIYDVSVSSTGITYATRNFTTE